MSVVASTARRAPGREAIGFLAGGGLMFLLVALLNPDRSEPWLAVGLTFSACALLAYAVGARSTR